MAVGDADLAEAKKVAGAGSRAESRVSRAQQRWIVLTAQAVSVLEVLARFPPDGGQQAKQRKRKAPPEGLERPSLAELKKRRRDDARSHRREVRGGRAVAASGPAAGCPGVW